MQSRGGASNVPESRPADVARIRKAQERGSGRRGEHGVEAAREVHTRFEASGLPGGR